MSVRPVLVLIASLVAYAPSCVGPNPDYVPDQADGDADADLGPDGDADGDADHELDGDAEADVETGPDADPCDCDDGVECTVDRCEDGGCVNLPDDGLCVEVGQCGIATCDAALGCLYEGRDELCDDGVECTVDACGAGLECDNAPDHEACVLDGQSCDPEEGCAFLQWVDESCTAAATCSSECSETAPCATIQQALGRTLTEAEIGLNVIRVRPGTYNTSGYEYDEGAKPVLLVGGPGVMIRTTSDRAFKITGSARFAVRSIDVKGLKRAFELEDSAQLTLEDVVMEGHTENAIKAKGTVRVFMDRCFVRASQRAGLRAAESARFEVHNSMIVGNGGGGEAGAFYSANGVSGTLVAVHVTIADNDGGSAAGAIGGRPTMTLANLILWNNLGGADPCPGCDLSTSLTEDPVFATAEGRARPEDYRITAGSLAEDRASWPLEDLEAPAHDYFGSRRVAPLDIGAHELTP